MLHGEVKINGSEIIRWSARRKQHPPQEINDYEVYAMVLGAHGITDSSRWTVMEHRFDDGAAALAAKVLRWVATWEREIL